MKKAMLVACLALLSACSGDATNNGQRKIAVILANTGPADFIGGPEWMIGKKIVQRYIDSGTLPKNLSFDFFDSGTNVKQAQEHFAAVVADPSYLAVIGPSTSGESLALADKAEAVGMPLLSLAASQRIVADASQPDGTKNWVFKFAQNDSLAANKLLAMIRNSKRDKIPSIALMYSDDGFGKSGEEVFNHAVTSSGLAKLELSRPFPPSMTSATGLTSSLPANLDALVIWGTSPGPSILVQELAKSRPDLDIFLSHGNASAQFIADTGLAAEGARLVGSRVLTPTGSLAKDNKSDAAVISYQEFWAENKLDGTPNHFAGHSYDAITLSIRILSDPAVDTRAEFRERLESTQNFYGVTGTFSFSANDHAGLTESAFASYEIKGGKFVVE